VASPHLQEMTASSHEVANTVEQITLGAERQAEMVEKASRLIREIAVSIDLVASSAKKLAVSANDTSSTAQSGGRVGAGNDGKNAPGTGQCREQRSAHGLLRTQVQKIGKIVEVITASRARPTCSPQRHHRGGARRRVRPRFAVVADEVRKLADSTSDSAAEITRLIEAIREENQAMQASVGRACHACRRTRGSQPDRPSLRKRSSRTPCSPRQGHQHCRALRAANEGAKGMSMPSTRSPGW